MHLETKSLNTNFTLLSNRRMYLSFTVIFKITFVFCASWPPFAKLNVSILKIKKLYCILNIFSLYIFIYRITWNRRNDKIDFWNKRTAIEWRFAIIAIPCKYTSESVHTALAHGRCNTRSNITTALFMSDAYRRLANRTLGHPADNKRAHCRTGEDDVV